jgi:hypothetical protein
MLKIVDIHVAETARGEYVVLQNQGLTTLTLRGWALCTDAYVSGDPDAAARGMYIFTQDEQIRPYTRVVLFTGHGESGWHPTTDGKHAFVTYWGRSDPAWRDTRYVHLLRLSTSRRVVPRVEMTVAMAGSMG